MIEKTESFKFEYTVPSLDWYDIIKIEIKEKDYTYFKLEKRFGKHLWLIGMKYKEKEFEWEEKQIGELQNDHDLKRFIKWAKQGRINRLIEIKTISGSLDIIEVAKKIVELTKEEG